MKKNIDTKKVSFLSKKNINYLYQYDNQSLNKNQKSKISLSLVFVLSILFFLPTFSAFSQEKLDETFKIISNPSGENLDNYIIALNTSNFECFRFESKSRILVFKTGIIVEFFSYNHLIENGLPQVNNCFISDNTIVNEYELQLVGNKIAILAPYDQSVKRAVK
jgi:hypothetical protein